MDINNYNIKGKKTIKKLKIASQNSTYLFYVYWIIFDLWHKNEKQKGKNRQFLLEISTILNSFKKIWSDIKITQFDIYPVIKYLKTKKIIETSKIQNKLFIVRVLDLEQYYLPKNILDDIAKKNKKLVPANYLRIYQYLKTLAISNLKSRKLKAGISQVENSYNYFNILNLDRNVIYKAIKWIIANNLPFEIENKTIKKKIISHINLEKNKFFKGTKTTKEHFHIELLETKRLVFREFFQGKVKFWSKIIFVWKVSKKLIEKIKKFFEYTIQRPCYLIKRTKTGWTYFPCWCNNGRHWDINKEDPKYKTYYQDKNLIIRRQGKALLEQLFERIKHIKSPWLKYLKIIY